MKHLKRYGLYFQTFKDNHMYIIANKESGMKKIIDIINIYNEKYRFNSKLKKFCNRDFGDQYMKPKGIILYYNPNLGFDNFNFYDKNNINADNLKYYLNRYPNREKHYLTIINNDIVEISKEEFLEELNIISNIDKYNI